MSNWTIGPNFPVHKQRGARDGFMPRAGSGPRSKPPGRWARDYDACLRCGRADRRYNGRGLCGTCYQKAYVAGEFDS